MEILLLNATYEDEFDTLVKDIEANLANKEFLLPIDEKLRSHFFDPEYTFMFGAFDGERLIGTMGLFMNKEKFGDNAKAIGYENEKVAEIGRVMCHCDYRGQGVMTQLIEKILDCIELFDLEYLIATIHPDNIPSQKLFGRHGFKKKGHIVKENGYERDIWALKV